MQSHISFCVIIKTNPRTEQHKYELSANANGEINYPIIEYENLYWFATRKKTTENESLISNEMPAIVAVLAQ